MPGEQDDRIHGPKTMSLSSSEHDQARHGAQDASWCERVHDAPTRAGNSTEGVEGVEGGPFPMPPDPGPLMTVSLVCSTRTDPFAIR